jgi:hypothetical protein
MSDGDTAETLVVRHLADIESAMRYLEDVLEPKFWAAVASHMEDWASARDWAGEFDPDSDEYLWMAARTWRTADGGDGDYDFWFNLEPIWGEADEEDTSNLSSFIGASARGNRRALVLKRVGPKKRVWQTLLGNSQELLQQLREVGFETDTRAGIISYPVELDGAVLGQALADDDFHEALEPLTTALATVEQALPLFERLIAAARTVE